MALHQSLARLVPLSPSLQLFLLSLPLHFTLGTAHAISEPHTKHLGQPGHVHPPLARDTKHADWVIILILAVVVFTVFAIGLMSQYRDTLILFCRSKQYLKDEEKEYEYEFGEMSHSAPGPQQGRARRRTVTAVEGHSRSTSLLDSSSAFEEAENSARWVTRNGNLNEQVVDVNGTRKVVLFVDSNSPENGGGAGGDEYAEWLRRWRREREERSGRLVEGERQAEGYTDAAE
ncbi:hypothetical protein BJY04DRAFT_116176 [Aspergillus karnatakaensis]|uniref:uncharacterized protein n=1 Tax=Aspergillus karnatakaensis TaxID=1810916 RepID=UPI003CCD1797